MRDRNSPLAPTVNRSMHGARHARARVDLAALDRLAHLAEVGPALRGIAAFLRGARALLDERRDLRRLLLDGNRHGRSSSIGLGLLGDHLLFVLAFGRGEDVGQLRLDLLHGLGHVGGLHRRNVDASRSSPRLRRTWRALRARCPARRRPGRLPVPASSAAPPPKLISGRNSAACRASEKSIVTKRSICINRAGLRGGPWATVSVATSNETR